MYLEASLVLAVFGGLIGLLLFIRWKRSFCVFRKYSIRGPPPELYYGNTRQIMKEGVLKFIDLNLKTYGNVFGFFVGIQPKILVKDLNILKQIMVKQFDHFMDRPSAGGMGSKSDPTAKDLFESKGNNWRRQRKILAKTFSAGKLKIMGPLIEQSCTSLVSKLKELSKDKQSFDIFNVYGRLTLQIILHVGFAHKVDLLNGSGKEDELADAVAYMFTYFRDGSMEQLTTICSNFPFIIKILERLIFKYSKLGKNMKYLEDRAAEIIQNRLQDDSNDYQDLLQLLIDAKPDSDDEESELLQTLNSAIYPPKKLTKGKIIKNELLFIAAGFETTQNTLSYSSYLLAIHPDYQEKIFEEIDEYFEANPNADLLEASQCIKYVDMVMNEALRIYPPLPVIDRKVLKDTEINGVMFPKDSIITIPIMAIHHSPDLWPEPSVFRPERFSKVEKEKRNPMTHMPFGYGPRQCIAMRLALMEAKMALIAIMKEYRFVETPDTEKPLKTSHGITLSPTNGIYLRVEKR